MATQGGNDDRPSNNNRGNNQQVTVGGLRKGPWTPEEDAILQDYVTKNGEGNWNVLQKLSGLNRCNKSCRLRWLNHLRPNLKKGAITAEEEAVIVQLHQKFGNKWAYIAKQLPGRTDNEIKNFWHTRRKKRQRANLPLYPTQSDKEEINNYIQPVSNISINPSPSSLPSSCMTTFVQPPIYGKLCSMSYSSNNNADQIYTFYPHNNNNQNYSVFPENNNNNAAGFIGQLNEGFINNLNSFTTFNLDSNPSPPLFRPKTYEHNSHQVVHTTQPNVDIFNQHSNANDGLLEDIVNQTKTLNHTSMKNIEVHQSHDHEFSWDYKIDTKGPISLQDLSLYGGQNFIQTNKFHESSSSFSVVGSMETDTVNSDFFNSLDNSPFTGGPMPDWYERSFNGVQQTTMPNMQELFNSSNSMAMAMATSTMAINSVLQTTLPENRQELFNPSNSMEMATSQPFMDNSGNWNIIPGSVHQAFNDNGNNDNISNIDQ